MVCARCSGQSKRSRQRHKAALLAEIFSKPQRRDSGDQSHSLSCSTPSDDCVDVQSSNVDTETLNLDDFEPVLGPDHATQPVAPPALSFEKEFLHTAVNRSIGRTTLNNFFTVFRKHKVGNFPRDARSCLGSLRRVNVVDMPPGKYYHFGLLACLQKILRFSELKSGDLIKLQLNVDGLPLARSSLSSFWPILCRTVAPFVSKVFVVGLFFSNSKPSKPDDVGVYLSQLINDLRNAYSNGISVNGRQFDVVIHSIVCDAPARQFVKCITGHSGYNSCERCTIKGVHVRKVVFLDVNSSLRTDDSFRSRQDSAHHHPQTSPFCSLPVNMIKDFSLDYMHLVLLGTVRRFLKVWLGIRKIKGSEFRKLPPAVIAKMNRRQKLCAATVPSEFQRKPRSFSFTGVFKATEYRTFLCYTSPFILLRVFEKRKHPFYSHFALIVVAMRILLSPNQNHERIEFSRKCLTLFVQKIQFFYGVAHMVYNVHCLIHLPDDYIQFGNLDRVSSFPFESFLGNLKSYVRRPGKELEQVVKRLHERTVLEEQPSHESKNNAVLKDLHCKGPLGPFSEVVAVRQYKEVCFNGQKYSLTLGNQFVWHNNAFYRIINIVKVERHVIFLCREFLNMKSVFSYPCESLSVGIGLVGKKLSGLLTAIHIREACKCWLVEYDDKDWFYIAKLLHDIK